MTFLDLFRAARVWLGVLAVIVLLSFVLPGWLSLLLLAGWFLVDACGWLDDLADQRIAQVSRSAAVSFKVPWRPGLVVQYVWGIAELVGAVVLVVWSVLLW